MQELLGPKLRGEIRISVFFGRHGAQIWALDFELQNFDPGKKIEPGTNSLLENTPEMLKTVRKLAPSGPAGLQLCVSKQYTSHIG